MTQVLGTELPVEWGSARLKDCTSFLNRGTAPDYVDDGPVRAVSQAVNQAGGLDWSRTRFHSYGGNPANLRGYLLERDILVNSTGTGTLGRVGYFKRSPDGLACMADGHVTVVRTRPDALWPRFGYYWLASTPFQDLISAVLSIGATNQIELSRERLSEAPVPLPPIEEQRRIADFLDAELSKLDDLASRRARQATLWAQRSRRHVAAQFEMSKSGCSTRLKYLLRSRPRYGVLVPEFVDTGVKLIRVNDLFDLESRAPDLVCIPEALSRKFPATVVQAGDILVSVVGTLGRAVIAPQCVEGANVNRAIAVLRVRDHSIAKLLLAWLAGAEFERQALDRTSDDSAQRTLGMEDIGNFVLRWPTDPSERSILEDTITQELEFAKMLQLRLSKQLALIAERRMAIVTAAVTGQIDVTTARGVEGS